MIKFRVIGLWAICALSGAVSWASVVNIHDMKTMIANADVVAHAEVLDKLVREDPDGRIITLTTLLVLDPMKGVSKNEKLTLYQVGGKLGNTVLPIIGKSEYRVGEEIIFFGERFKNFVVSYGLGVGKFRVERTPNQVHVLEELGEVHNINMASEFGDGRNFSGLGAFKSAIAQNAVKPFELERSKKKFSVPELKSPRMNQLHDDSRNFRYICNTLDAYGNLYEDGCGICNAETAPRWVPSAKAVYTDTSVLPDFLTPETWKSLVNSSLLAWNRINGSSLYLELGPGNGPRKFSSKSNIQEIFWITDRDEWMQKVGSGANNALGVTIAPYKCPGYLQKSREIQHSVMAFNGTGVFNWKLDCSDSSCVSIQSTLTHELGHFVGLGHPCVKCSWSVMTSKAGHNINFPLFIDEEAVRSIYPNSDTGLLGQSCSSGSQCSDDSSCINQATQDFCSLSCSSDSDCPESYYCLSGGDGSFCSFMEKQSGVYMSPQLASGNPENRASAMIIELGQQEDFEPMTSGIGGGCNTGGPAMPNSAFGTLFVFGFLFLACNRKFRPHY